MKLLYKSLQISLLLLVSTQAFALPNDKFGRTVNLNTDGITDTYTDTDPNNSNQTFNLGFPAGTDQTLIVYPALNSIAPPPATVKNYAGLDATSTVLQINMGVTQAIMDAFVSGGTIASYAVLDPTFPPPPIGAIFAGQGVGQGNFGVPIPYLAQTPSNWPGPGPAPNSVPMALDRLANRLATVNATTPSRTLNSAAFVPNNQGRVVFACYTVRVACSITLGGTCTGTAQIVSDSGSPPTTVRTQTQMSLGGTIVVGLTLANSQDIPICYMVPPGDKVIIKTIVGAGAPAFTLVQQTEEIIH